MERLNQEDDTLIHISHRHPLHLTDLAGGDAAPPYCHACRFPCTGSIYQCAPCGFVLHPPCARFARTIRHPSHPGHDLTLRLTPAGEDGCHLCRACRHIGYSWSFCCEPCGFHLHLPCAALPGSATAPAHAHRHQLSLTYEDPRRSVGSFDFCAVCRRGLSTARWFYACRECGVGAHVGCVVPADMPLALGHMYAALDKVQKAVADAARWPDGPLPEESQQLQELLNEQVSELVSEENNAGGMLPLFAMACED